MKKIIYIIVAVLTLQFYSCNEVENLKEVPLDFYSPGNAFLSPEDVNASLVYLYARLRGLWTASAITGDVYFDTDIVATGYTHIGFGDYQVLLKPTSSAPLNRWTELYRIIYDANVVLGRVEGVPYKDANLKKTNLGEALFFRAYAYRCLAHFFGGVPIILEELTGPRTDFVRATLNDVYEQCRKDLEAAIAILPQIDKVADGRISKEAANHLITEIYICQKKWDLAIASASAVINNPNMSLMNARFGSSTKETGDVYYDLFEPNNQNRKSGNKEAILVLQMEFNQPGGYGNYSSGGTFTFERHFTPSYWSIKDPSGVAGFIGPTSKNGGRGIGWFATAVYYQKYIWTSDFNNDIRNAPHNLQRDYLFDNPQSKFFGTKVSEAFKNYAKPTYPAFVDTTAYFFAYPTKLSTHGKHPSDQVQDATTGLLIPGRSGGTYLDQYLMRLAETYLLRAEAYLGKGQKDLAAADINTIRTRAKANPITADKVTIDYILDERARELSFEEPRRLTLSRLGVLYDRVKKYGRFSATTIQPYHALYPIPFSEIERNTGAVLTQNPGYTN